MSTPQRYATCLNDHRKEICTECGKGLGDCSCLDPNAQAMTRLLSREGQTLGLALNQVLAFPSSDTQALTLELISAIGVLFESLRLRETQEAGEIPAQQIFREGLRVIRLLTVFLARGERGMTLYQPDEVFRVD